MRATFKLRPLAAAIALLCAAGGAAAAPPSQADLARLLEQLNQRMEKLERRNLELERELRANRVPQAEAKTPAASDIENRVRTLEAQQAQISAGLESEALSEREPELTARLKAVEMQARNASGAAKKVDALEGFSAGFSLTTVAQKSPGVSDANSQLNYRADAFVTLPLDKVGDIAHKVYAQFRLGQGAGLNALASFSKPNATAFQLQGGLRPDDSVATLAQAWYQANIPLPFGGHKPHSQETLEVTFGKMDPFVFFDQNAAAGDETRQFLNSAFVHNPLLDAGGDIGVDANGFTPGFRLSYANAKSKQQTWRLSFGAFGAGEQGSNYRRSLSVPLLMLQAETEQRLFDGLPGAYRVYAWRNPQAASFDPNAAGTEAHSGFGISADQGISDGITLFGRYGHSLQGHVRFDRALTLGAEFNGSSWRRGGDTIGVAGGWLKTSQDYRSATPGVSGAERVFELYYRWRLAKQFELSPSFQYIGNPGGDGSADGVKIFGLRAQLTY